MSEDYPEYCRDCVHKIPLHNPTGPLGEHWGGGFYCGLNKCPCFDRLCDFKDLECTDYVSGHVMKKHRAPKFKSTDANLDLFLEAEAEVKP